MCETASGPTAYPFSSQEEPPSKKKRVDSTVGWTGETLDSDEQGRPGSTVGLSCTLSATGGKTVPQDEVDEIEVYGSEAQSGTQLATYSFEVRLGKAEGIHRLRPT